MSTLRIIEGDALAVLAGMDAESVDALVTDPPAGISFMGRTWDRDHGGREGWVSHMTGIFKECRRVMKPGAHALVWAIPRTSHWTATAVESAGFEIRDVLTHHFGSGFPKSHNLDGGLGTALKPATEHWILSRKPLVGTVAANVAEHGTGALNVDGCRVGTDIITTRNTPGVDKFANKYSGAMVSDRGDSEHAGRWPPNLLLTHAADCKPEDYYDVMSEALWEAGRNVARCAADCPVAEMDRQSGESTSTQAHQSAGFRDDAPVYGGGKPVSRLSGANDSGGASRYFPRFRYEAKAPTNQRWGILTCDCETLDSTVWENEDRSRPGPTDATSRRRDTSEATLTDASGLNTALSGKRATDPSLPGFKSTTPTGTSSTTGSKTSGSSPQPNTSGCTPAVNSGTESGGSPAVAAEPSSESTTKGGISRRRAGPSTGAVDVATSLKSSRTNVCEGCGVELRVSAHPTQKPIDLMRWLCRLVTPPGGLILDPFMGSGTTGIAALREGFRFVGIEREAEYVEIARRRIEEDAPLFNRGAL